MTLRQLAADPSASSPPAMEHECDRSDADRLADGLDELGDALRDIAAHLDERRDAAEA